MSKLKSIFISSLAALIAIPAIYAYAPEIRQELTQQLEKADNAADSLNILYNIFDTSSNAERKMMGGLMMNTAKRAGDLSAQFDILRLLSGTSNRNDTLETFIQRELDNLPDCRDKKMTETFMQMRHDIRLARTGNEATNQRRVLDLIPKLKDSHNMSTYDHIVVLHAICAFYSTSAEKDLLTGYFNKLLDLADHLPEEDFPIKSLIYTQGAVLLLDNEDYPRAAHYNRKVIEMTDSMRSHYLKEGRVYRNYNSIYFMRYLSILASYRSIPITEINQAYDSILKLSSIDPEISAYNDKTHAAEVFYLMAHKNYDKALPLLLKHSDDQFFKTHYRQTLKMIIKAAAETGNAEALNDASKKYIKLLEDYLTSRSFEKYKELQLHYDIRSSHESKQLLTAHYEHLLSKEADKQHIFIIAGVVLLTIIVSSLLIRLRRWRSEAESLSGQLSTVQSDNNRLSKQILDYEEEKKRYESAFHVKSDFLLSIGPETQIPLDAIVENSRLLADSVTNESKPYLDRYADIIESNANILQGILSDTVALAELDSDRLNIIRTGVNPQQVCEIVVDTAISNRHDDHQLNIICEHNSTEKAIITDQRRLEQILNILLNNAIKFTPKGTITVAWNANERDKTVSFAVTDTGIGIPPAKSEEIFQRYVKLDKFARGVGIGLTVARMVADRLGGTLVLDTNYRRGARFILTIPIV